MRLTKTVKQKQLVGKAFDFSLDILQLYIQLLKHNEFEISEKLLESSTRIRGSVEHTLAALDKQDYLSRIAMASKEAIEARYWLKVLQMKNIVSSQCDDCAEKLNEIIITLSYMTQLANRNRIPLTIIHNLN